MTDTTSSPQFPDSEPDGIVPPYIEEKLDKPTPKPKKAAKATQKSSMSAPKSEEGQTIATSGADKVYLSKIIYKNVNARKSLSVKHLQRRLKEWGFPEAYADQDGWYGDLTASSVSQFQEAVELPVTGRVDAETLTRLFENDSNVEVVL